MEKKERAIEFMRDCFGAATASTFESLEEDYCLSKARTKIFGVFGDGKVQEFDNFLSLNFK